MTNSIHNVINIYWEISWDFVIHNLIMNDIFCSQCDFEAVFMELWITNYIVNDQISFQGHFHYIIKNKNSDKKLSRLASRKSLKTWNYMVGSFTPEIHTETLDNQELGTVDKSNCFRFCCNWLELHCHSMIKLHERKYIENINLNQL